MTDPTEACALVTATFQGTRYVLLVETDSGWAMPGGAIVPGENPIEAACRKCAEETGFALAARPEPITLDEPRRMPDPDGAVTVVARCDLGEVDALPEVRAGDDAQDAGWWRAPSDLMALGAAGMIFPAHRGILGALR